jgi:uncharacterized sporulation protein YeaH/YhbH (DUF444 family)
MLSRQIKHSSLRDNQGVPDQHATGIIRSFHVRSILAVDLQLGDIFSNRQHQIVVTSTRWNGNDHVESQGLTGRIKRFSSLELRKSIAEYLNMAPVMPQRETSDSLRRQIDELRIEAARLLSESEKTKRAAEKLAERIERLKKRLRSDPRSRSRNIFSVSSHVVRSSEP